MSASFFRSRGRWLLAGLFVLLPLGERALAEPETTIEISAVGGLRFEPARFAVEPGTRVKVVIENTDDMAHNFVLLKPGARMEVVEAANVMPITPTSDFIPKSDKIIQHSPLLIPSKSAIVRFTAPMEEAVYPYVCTFPGHGLIMYGAMYVTKKALPPFASDTNLPEIVREAGDGATAKRLHAFAPTPPYLYRNFLRDSGPASIAVCLPGGQNYCWDAGECRLRYAWTGAFLDPSPHWAGNGDAFAEVKGRIYYRAAMGAVQLYLGGKDKVVTRKFLGYRLVDRYPEFHYTIDGVDVRELIKPLHHGSGIESTFTVGTTNSALTYTFNPESGAKATSSAGEIKDGRLVLTAEQAKKFTVTLTEIPGKEPLRYWSMNDTFNGKKASISDVAVKGRAAAFDGAKSQVNTDLKTDLVSGDASFAAWVKVRKGKEAKAESVVFGAIAGPAYFLLGWNLAGAPGFGLVAAKDKDAAPAHIATEQPPDGEWHHLAFTLQAGTFTLYCDGQKVGTAQGALPPKTPIYFGSAVGQKFANMIMDEARLDDRAWTPAEIAALFQRERPQTTTAPVE